MGTTNNSTNASSIVDESGPSVRIFVASSLAYLVTVLAGSYLLGYFGKGTALQPNEWGDVLAGVFSPLAFLWLLYASLSQRAELALQRRELRDNNCTQHEQQEQMSRQADALSAQVEALKKQAHATYEPVLVLTALLTAPGQAALATVVNVGNDAIEVETGENQTLVETDGEMIRGGKLSHWPRGARVDISIANPTGSLDTLELILIMQRLDLEKLTLEFTVNIAAARLNFVRRTPALQPT